MGSARTAPNPKFEKNLKATTEQPEGMGRTTSILNSFTGGGTGIQNAMFGIVRPTASATIKAPEPSEREDSDEVQDTEQNFEDVRSTLLAKAKERRSKISEKKEDAMSRMSMPSAAEGLAKFTIENYRAGGADFDRDDTKSIGDDMTTGKPKISERVKSFLSGINETSPLQFMVRGG